jgi:ribosome biogenesis GTPase
MMDNNKDELVEKYKKQISRYSQKQNLRAAKRKLNPKALQKKPRRKKVSIKDWNDWEDQDFFEYKTFEPILSKGEQERRRKVEKQVSENNNGHSPINHEEMENNLDERSTSLHEGLVVEAGSGMCSVDINGDIVVCEIRGNLKNAQSGYVNVVAVGDHVFIHRTDSDRGVVEAIGQRKNLLTRPYAPDVGKTSDLEQIVATNVDQVLIVSSWREPFIWPALIDRYLIAADRNNIEPIICINKIDLVEDKDDFNRMINVYKEIRYRMVLTSNISGDGIRELQDTLENKTTVLVGLSGVGKSSLLNSINPELSITTGQVSTHGLYTGQGRHTTTRAALWKTDVHSLVIDTPGVKSFEIADILPENLSSWYPEMIDSSKDCRFADCRHINEPGCGVIAAVNKELISDLRYKNYIQIFEELSTS